jgi:hypothetical protein
VLRRGSHPDGKMSSSNVGFHSHKEELYIFSLAFWRISHSLQKVFLNAHFSDAQTSEQGKKLN